MYYDLENRPSTAHRRIGVSDGELHNTKMRYVTCVILIKHSLLL